MLRDAQTHRQHSLEALGSTFEHFLSIDPTLLLFQEDLRLTLVVSVSLFQIILKRVNFLSGKKRWEGGVAAVATNDTPEHIQISPFIFSLTFSSSLFLFLSATQLLQPSSQNQPSPANSTAYCCIPQHSNA